MTSTNQVSLYIDGIYYSNSILDNNVDNFRLPI